MRLIDADAEIARLENEIEKHEASLEYWKTLLSVCVDDAGIERLIFAENNWIKEAARKIKYLSSIPDAVPEDAAPRTIQR